jgi:DNA polymerase-3 subunit delta'
MVAKALNCLQAGPDDFCDACTQCHKINAGTHPDVLRIEVEDDASEIKIAQIRQVLQMLDLRPFEGRSKVFIIDPANAMNAAAANALLKGLEEPPENSYFILLATNLHELMLTVRSRCQIYPFTPVTLDEIRSAPGAMAVDELVLRWSRGSVGLIKALNAATLKQQREVVLDFLETAITANEAEFRNLMAASQDLSRAKQEFEEYLEMIGVLLADLLYLNEGASEKVINLDIRKRLESLAGRLPSDRLFQISEFLKSMESSLKNYANRQMLTDVLALTANDAVSKILHDNRP